MATVTFTRLSTGVVKVVYDSNPTYISGPVLIDPNLADDSVRITPQLGDPITIVTADTVTINGVTAGTGADVRANLLATEIFFLVEKQIALRLRNIAYRLAVGSGSTSSTNIGASGGSVTGTATGRSQASTNSFTQRKRLGYVSAGTAGSSAGVRDTTSPWRGNAAGLGGFTSTFKFGLATANAGFRVFVGHALTTGALPNANPSALTSVIGMAKDDSDTNFKIIYNDGSGTASSIDLGASFPATTANTDWYELEIWCLPNGSAFYYRVRNVTSGALATGSVTTDLPANTTFFSQHVWVNNGAVASAAEIDLGLVYIEPSF